MKHPLCMSTNTSAVDIITQRMHNSWHMSCRPDRWHVPQLRCLIIVRYGNVYLSNLSAHVCWLVVTVLSLCARANVSWLTSWKHYNSYIRYQYNSYCQYTLKQLLSLSIITFATSISYNSYCQCQLQHLLSISITTITV